MGVSGDKIQKKKLAILCLFVYFLVPLVCPSSLLATVSQNHFAYLDDRQANKRLLNLDEQMLFADYYLRQHFLPWTKKGTQYERKRVEAFFSTYLSKLARQGERNVKKERIIRNANLGAYPSYNICAITTGRIDILGLPYRSKRNTGLNLTLQASSVPRGTPLFISHQSRDRRWLFVETGFVCGWTTKENLAPVSQSLIEEWRRNPLVTIIRDGDKYAAGELYPLIEEQEAGWRVLVPQGDMEKGGRLKEAFIPRNRAALFPYPLTYANIGQVANELTGKPYGWGGINGWRDCSALLRDLFSPFGIWLPRHSSDQALEGGIFIDLSNMTRDEKRTQIITRGVPYLTLLWIKGHIMLYIGTKDGQPFVFHSFRRTLLQNGNEIKAGKIVGKSCITTLEGENAPRDLLSSVRGMIILACEAAQ